MTKKQIIKILETEGKRFINKHEIYIQDEAIEEANYFEGVATGIKMAIDLLEK